VRGVLQLGLPSSADVAGYFVSKWWEAVIAKFSGKPDIAEKAIDALIDMQRQHLAARDASETRAYELHMAHAQALRETLAMQGRAIEQFATPVGASVDRAEISREGAR
jgi:hypothetical protein